MSGSIQAPKRTFLSQKHANTRFVVSREVERVGRASDGLSIVEPIAEKEKYAEFYDGLCSTNDEVVIEWLLDHRHFGIYPSDDNLADVRFTFGDETVEAVERAIRQKLAAAATAKE